MGKMARKAVLVFSILGTMTAFQNCSPMQFQSSEIDNSSLCVDGSVGCNSGGGNNNSGGGTDPGGGDGASGNQCQFDGRIYAEGEQVVAYQSSSVGAGSSCVSQVRRCQSGSFTGSYAFAHCSVAQPSACLFDGRTISHGENVTAYVASAVAFGQSCQSELRSCSNGALSGSFSYASCAVGSAASCLFNGQTYAHGASVRAFAASSVAYGQSCVSESRVCNNGALSGTYTHSSCTVGTAASCTFNGQTVAHGQPVTAYASSSVASGSACVAQSRVCNNGVLSGSYNFGSCTVSQPASCLFNGKTIAHGEPVIAYAASAGATCAQQTRTCNNGTLSGSYLYSSCQVTVSCAAGKVYNASLGRCVSALYGQYCTYYGAVTDVMAVFNDRHCHLDNGGAWVGQNFCEYNSRGCGLGTCQCYTDGTYNEDGVCHMAAHRKAAWERSYIPHFGYAHLLPSSPRASQPTSNACQ